MDLSIKNSATYKSIGTSNVLFTSPAKNRVFAYESASAGKESARQTGTIIRSSIHSKSTVSVSSNPEDTNSNSNTNVNSRVSSNNNQRSTGNNNSHASNNHADPTTDNSADRTAGNSGKKRKRKGNNASEIVSSTDTSGNSNNITKATTWESSDSEDSIDYFPDYPSAPESPTPDQNLAFYMASIEADRPMSLVYQERVANELKQKGINIKEKINGKLKKIEDVRTRKGNRPEVDQFADAQHTLIDTLNIELKGVLSEYAIANSDYRKANAVYMQHRETMFEKYRETSPKMIGYLEKLCSQGLLNELRKLQEYKEAVSFGDVIRVGYITQLTSFDADTENQLVNKQKRLQQLLNMKMKGGESFAEFSARYLNKYTELSSFCDDAFLSGENESNLVERLIMVGRAPCTVLVDGWIANPNAKPKTVTEAITAMEKFEKRIAQIDSTHNKPSHKRQRSGDEDEERRISDLSTSKFKTLLTSAKGKGGRGDRSSRGGQKP